MIKFLNKSFNPGVWMTCFVIFFLPILLYLGYWQISRGFEKKAIWEAYSINKTLPPILEKELSLYMENADWFTVGIMSPSYKLAINILRESNMGSLLN